VANLLRKIIERNEKTTIKLDSTLLREMTTLKEKIQDRAHRIELLEKELDSHKSQSEYEIVI